MQATILIAGELNVDLVLQGDRVVPVPGKEVLADQFAIALGSASAICAAGLARLGHAVRFVGRVGADYWGEYCVDTLGRSGVDTSRIGADPQLQTGVTVSLSCALDRALVTYLGAIVGLRAADVEDDALSGVTHLHVSSFFLQKGLRPGCRELFARASGRGITTSLDCGHDPDEQWNSGLREVLAETDIFLPNGEELCAITGCRGPIEALSVLENGRTRTVAKLGSQGCLTLERGEALHVPALPVDAVDTTGAGDSFNAGFLHAWLEGRDVHACLRFASACGSLSTQALGGIAAQATVEDVERAIQERG